MQVGGEDDRQQANDGQADGYDVVDAGEPKGNEKGESGLRTISSGAEGIQAEDGNSGDGTDMLSTLFRGCERLADDNVEERHRSSFGRLQR